MTKTIAWCILVVALGLVGAIAAAAPAVLSDGNAFLRNFVTHEFLAILAVIVSITLASISQLHLTFNRIERAEGRRFLTRTRAGVRQAAYWLIGLMVAGAALLVAKPLVATEPWSEALANGMALWLLLWNLLILISVTQAAFAVGPEVPDDPA